MLSTSSEKEDVLTLTLDEERMLVGKLLTEGWEQGCWLPDSITQHSLDAASQRRLLDTCGTRSRLHLEEELLAQGKQVPETIPQDEQCPDDTVWLLASQRCDVIKGLRDEPLVSLIRATKRHRTDAQQLARKSPNLSIARVEGDDAWVVDFREVITIPKAALASFQVRQCLPSDEQFRREFALKYAQKMWRRPVPRDIQTRIEKPLEDMRKKGKWKPFFAATAEFLVDRDADSNRFKIHAILGESMSDEIELDRFFYDVVLPHLNPDEDSWLDYEGSDVRAAETVNLRMVFRTYKLSLDHLSLGLDVEGPDY